MGDARLGSIVVNGTDPSMLTMEVVEAQKAAGVTVWVGSWSTEFEESYAFISQHSEHIVPALNVADIRRAHRQGKMAYVFHWQHATQLQIRGSIDGPAINDLAYYHGLGLRICGIAYNNANVFGGGCFDPEIGLTRNGRELVRRIHEQRIVLDVGGHTGEQSSIDAIKITSGIPVICSHTNCRSLVDNKRNTSDRVIEAIAKTGGVVGITAFNDFHVRTGRDPLGSPQVDLEAHLDHFDHLKGLVGVAHIGVSPDFMAGWEEEWSATPLQANGSVTTRDAEAYSQGRDLYVKGFESIAQLPNLATGLTQRGWSQAEIDMVMGGNWLRVYEAVWGA
ncbi:dipeptidase [Pedococcus sp. P5_B7]